MEPVSQNCEMCTVGRHRDSDVETTLNAEAAFCTQCPAGYVATLVDRYIAVFVHLEKRRL